MPENNRPPKSRRRRILIVAASVLAGLLLLVLAGGLWLRAQLTGSLPRLAGEVHLQGLTADVRIERDELGVPGIFGENPLDVTMALGYVHAQDRFFQMDLMRRQSAGELAELFGALAIDMDRQNRVYRFRERAAEALALCDADLRTRLSAYTRGVNAGLADLGAKPFEYLALRSEPAPWLDEDSMLVIYTMFLDLNMDGGTHETSPATLRATAPRELADFLLADGCTWDAPLVGDALEVPPIPGPEVLDLRERESTPSSPGNGPTLPAADSAGSNNWAIAGSHTAHGRALMANDMHLGISIPNTWYRALLSWPDHRLIGTTLPGLSAIVTGSNTHVAWGFTNAYGDWLDLVVIETAPGDTTRYRTPEGLRAFELVKEVLEIKGGTPDTLEVRSTIWGPIVARDQEGRPLAMHWTALQPDGANMQLLRLEDAMDLDEALIIAANCGVPAVNFVCSDDQGRIGWTIAGLIPRRTGFSGRLPRSWADGQCRWDGWLDPAQYPRIIDPPDGLIWTANARVVDGPMLEVLGNSGYALGARAMQIRDGLRALHRPAEADMLALQLDDRALFLEPWRRLLLDLETTHAQRPDSLTAACRQEFFRLVRESWDGHASVSSVGYRLVRTFRREMDQAVFGWLTDPFTEADERFSRWDLPQREGPLWKLVTERPAHLLDTSFPSWEEALLAGVDSVAAHFTAEGRPLAECTWGDRNVTAIRHPLSLAVPQLGQWLNMPAHALPGGSHMPRVTHPTSGASQRMVISPGHEEDGFYHMPCGQSGHPMSPFYRAGHADWENGAPSPLLPGQAIHTLILRPGTS